MKECNSTRKTNIFEKEMVISRPDIYAGHDGFWKLFDFDKNNPI